MSTGAADPITTAADEDGLVPFFSDDGAAPWDDASATPAAPAPPLPKPASGKTGEPVRFFVFVRRTNWHTLATYSIPSCYHRPALTLS